ncbi:MAG: hypothetical protein KatS3mg119_2095 [Rhodothalassiaceae bacterium]|nr:MAG: hypothetical protein KatS3mg119_2095 [Rhodothalassiaceae bacterium]
MSLKRKTKLLAVAVPAALLAGTALSHAQTSKPFAPMPGPTTFPPFQCVVSDRPECLQASNIPGPNGEPCRCTLDGKRFEYRTPGTLFPQSYPFGEDATNPSNLLPTIYGNQEDSAGNEIPNTLPSTPEDPYNLHPDPVVTDLEDLGLSEHGPEDDLAIIIKRLKEAVSPIIRLKTRKMFFRGGVGVPADPRRGVEERFPPEAGTLPDPVNQIDLADVQMAIDILEGNPLPDRAYSGIPVLNYVAGVQVQHADENNVFHIHQVWTRRNIMSDTAYICPGPLPTGPCAGARDVRDVPFKIRYTIDVTERGHEDFAPMIMYFDDPNLRGGAAVPNVSFDGTFFPMEEGKRYVFELDHAPGRFYNLTYHWGWRIHPTRIQAVENGLKTVGPKNIIEWETETFGPDPRGSEENKLAAISMIGDYAPAKRMWKAFRALRDMNGRGPRPVLRALVREIEEAFDDWKDRNKLPRGFQPAEGYDETFVYLNNQIYADIPGIPSNFQQTWDEFQTRGATLEVKLFNGDYFPHGYINIDFGGARGWENIFHNTIPLGGQGPWFTFGRHNWIPNIFPPVLVPAAERPEDDSIFALIAQGHYRPGGKGKGRRLGLPSVYGQHAKRVAWKAKGGILPVFDEFAEQTVESTTPDGIGELEVVITFRHDPPQRLRIYQFDPMHHNVAIWSVH